MNYGFIGFGNLAKAIHGGLEEKKDITFGYMTKSEGPEGLHAFADIAALAAFADVIWLCVKPQNAAEVLEELGKCPPEGKLIVSPMAGRTIASIESALPKGTAIMRIMPNLAIAYRASVTACATNGKNAPQEERVKADLASLGKLVELPEKHFDLFTAIFGSGPAFLLKLIEGLRVKTRELEVSDEVANELLAGLFAGTVIYFEENRADKSITELIAAITSKGGTTEAGLRHFTDNDLGKLFSEVIEAAAARSRELSA